RAVCMMSRDRLSPTPRLSYRHGASVLQQVWTRGVGEYRKQTLIERYGADVRLPDLREEIAKCRRRGMHDACMVHYVALRLSFHLLAVFSHAIPIIGYLAGLKIAVSPFCCCGITGLNCFFSRHRLRRVGFRSRARFRSLIFFCKGWRVESNNNRGHYQKCEALHEGLHLMGLAPHT